MSTSLSTSLSLAEAASLAVSAAGVVTGLFTFATTRRLDTSLGVALDLFTAAGLLRLSAVGTWSSVATAATILVIRKLVGAAFTPVPRPRAE